MDYLVGKVLHHIVLGQKVEYLYVGCYNGYHILRRQQDKTLIQEPDLVGYVLDSVL